MDISYIQDNINYDLTINGIVYHGNIEYVTDHVADGPIDAESTLTIAKSQPKDLQELVNRYFIAKETNPQLSFEEWYTSF